PHAQASGWCSRRPTFHQTSVLSVPAGCATSSACSKRPTGGARVVASGCGSLPQGVLLLLLLTEHTVETLTGVLLSETNMRTAIRAGERRWLTVRPHRGCVLRTVQRGVRQGTGPRPQGCGA